jgi:nucleoside-diphosphate-sugar epimerase
MNFFGWGSSHQPTSSSSSEPPPPPATQQEEPTKVVQAPLEPGFQTAGGCHVLVTGSSGLCGSRLVEMLLERGATTVIAFDITSPSQVRYLQERFDAVQAKTGGNIIVCSGREAGDLTSDAAVEKAFQAVPQIDVCFHLGALVGPFYDHDTYYAVNTEGTRRIIDMCRKYKVPKLVYSSSPSTRFTGEDVTGQTEDQLPFPQKWLAKYAETKAYGEMQVSKACSDTLLTISVAPHQVYGPYDNLFLPNLLETAGNGRLRIFGKGDGKISVCYADNYVHGLLCGADALYPNSPALGQFYIVTDGEPHLFWKLINQAVLQMGFTDLYSKFHLPEWFLYLIAYIANAVGYLLNKKFKLNPFNVRMLTMHRYFSIERAKRDLHYQPVVPFDQAWKHTLEWFKEHWLPEYQSRKKQKKQTKSTDSKKKQ